MIGYRVMILVPFDETHLDRVQRFGVGVYCEFITTQERNQLFSTGGGGLTLDDLRTKYPDKVDEINGQAGNVRSEWADAATPTVKSYYCGALDITDVQWGRTQGWLAVHTDKWIRCNWVDDALEYDECGSEITGMPTEGTDTYPTGDGHQLLLDAGFVPWQGAHGD